MAKIQKRKLQWTASESSQVVAYKLYWAQGDKVNYDCPCTRLGNVTEVVLPDDVEGFYPDSGPIEFGIAAVDESGNESDLITVSATHQFNAPQAPGEFWIDDRQDRKDASQPDNAPLPESESHISLLERTIKGEESAKSENSSDPSAAVVDDSQDPAKHFGRP